MRISVKWLLLIAVVFVAIVVANLVTTSDAPQPLTADQTIEQAVAFWKNEVPREIDKKTILIGVEASGKALIYKFKMKAPKADINLENFPHVVAAAMKRTTCENVRKANSLKLGVVFLYVYHDENLEEIYRMKLQQQDCREY
jgi:hypothetical protein